MVAGCMKVCSEGMYSSRFWAMMPVWTPATSMARTAIGELDGE